MAENKESVFYKFIKADRHVQEYREAAAGRKQNRDFSGA